MAREASLHAPDATPVHDIGLPQRPHRHVSRVQIPVAHPDVVGTHQGANDRVEERPLLLLGQGG